MIGLWLVAIGQTLTLLGAVFVTVVAVVRTRKAQAASEKVTWSTILQLGHFVDRRIARDAISWGALLVLLGLAVTGLGAWLQVFCSD